MYVPPELYVKKRDEWDEIFRSKFTKQICLDILLNNSGRLTQSTGTMSFRIKSDRVEVYDISAIARYESNDPVPTYWGLLAMMSINGDGKSMGRVVYEVRDQETIERLNSLYTFYETEKMVRSRETYIQHLDKAIDIGLHGTD